VECGSGACGHAGLNLWNVILVLWIMRNYNNNLTPSHCSEFVSVLAGHGGLNLQYMDWDPTVVDHAGPVYYTVVLH
jgi:hypothetical protein